MNFYYQNIFLIFKFRYCLIKHLREQDMDSIHLWVRKLLYLSLGSHLCRNILGSTHLNRYTWIDQIFPCTCYHNFCTLHLVRSIQFWSRSDRELIIVRHWNLVLKMEKIMISMSFSITLEVPLITKKMWRNCRERLRLQYIRLGNV